MQPQTVQMQSLPWPAGMGSRDLTFEVTGTGGTEALHTSDAVGKATVKYVAATANVTAKTASAPTARFDLTEATSLDLQFGEFVAPAAPASAATNSIVIAPKATVVSVTTSSSKNTVGSEVANINNLRLTADKATTLTVNAAGEMNGAIFVVKSATSANITNGETAGVLRLDTTGAGANVSKLTSLTLTSGNTLDLQPREVVTTSRPLTALQTLTVNANKGLVKITTDGTTASQLAKVNVITLTGSGDGSAVTLGALGANTNGYGLSLTTSGTLKGGVTTGAIDITKGQAVVIDATGVTGIVTLSTIGATDHEAGSVTIKAASSGTATTSLTQGLVVSNIFATGAVLIDSKGARKTEIGDVSGDSITIDMSNNSTAAYTLGSLTAKSSVDLTLSELAAQKTDLTITAATGSTGLNAKVVGGVNIEGVTISDGGKAVTSIVVTGDLGAGANTLTVTGTSSTAKSINLSGFANYKNATIQGGTGADTILGGAGVDRIEGGAGANVLEGGAGADVFFFSGGNSPVTAINKINDLKAEDSIVYGAIGLAKKAEIKVADAVTVADTDTAVSGATAKVSINANGVAVFEAASGSTSAAYDTISEMVSILSAVTTMPAGAFVYFADPAGVTNMFISGGTANAITDDTVVQLVGVSLPGTAPTAGAVTGIAGIGA